MTSGRGSDSQNNEFSYLAHGKDGGIFTAAELSETSSDNQVDTMTEPIMNNNSATYLIV